MNLPPEEIERLREFVYRWSQAGPALECIRHEKLRSLSDEEARRISGDLLNPWTPASRDLLGEELVVQQRVFSRYAMRARQLGSR